MPAAKTLRREFLQLAGKYIPGKSKVAGLYISEKLDGTRCFWDGGLTRGRKTESVPWASVVNPETGERKPKIKPLSTGLWSRYGNPIMAPDWFLNALPACPLDGELWAGRGNFQRCRSICGGDQADPRFNEISYAVYSSPALGHVFQTGLIKNANMLCSIDMEQIIVTTASWVEKFEGEYTYVRPGSNFDQELLFLQGAIETQNDQCFLHNQIKLSADETEARAFVEDFLEKTLEKGGKGVVIRDPSSIWTPKRHNGLLKYKPYDDDEATVVGFISGEVGRQGNVLGKIGALVVKWKDKEFKIGTGLKMHQREFTPRGELGAKFWAEAHPGERLPAEFNKSHDFVIGDKITFLYRELSDDGIPKEARFWRKRNDVE